MYDYIVVGGGAAGCVLATRLAENPEHRVALIEAGGPLKSLAMKVPALAYFAAKQPQYNWHFETEPVAALGGRTLRWYQGKVVGGSGSINGMNFMRGTSAEFDAWQAAGCDGWSYSDVLPYFKKCETNARGGSRWHGDSGPLQTRPSNLRLPICDAFVAAASEAGFPVSDDLNADVMEGFGYYDVNIGHGRRSNSGAVYLKVARRRKNFSLLTDAFVLRILIERGRATGVEVSVGSNRETIQARREVIVCAGAINTPQLLMLSGIGPGAHLQGHGIPVLVDAPEVGNNLANHPAYRLQYECTGNVTAFAYLQPFKAVLAAGRYALTRTGPLGEAFAATGGLFRTDPQLDIPNMFVIMTPVLVKGIRDVNLRLHEMLPERDGFQIGAFLGRPLSRGSIRLRSTDPTQPPRIDTGYYGDPADMRSFAKGISRLRAMMRGNSIRGMIRAELQPTPDVRDEDLETELKARGETSFHPSGTARMGSDPGSVVDPMLRVRGVSGLRVADPSVMPAPLCAGTHGPAMMIAEKAADLIERPP